MTSRAGTSARDTQAGGPGDGQPIGYSIVLPPGWRRIPVRWGSKKAIRDAADDALRVLPPGAPPDKVGPYRKELERRLTDLVRDARGKGGIDLCLPVQPVYGAPMAASFIVSEVSAALTLRDADGNVDTTADPAQLLTMYATGDDDAKLVTVDGAMGVRIERVADPSPANGVDFPSHQVNYVMSVPGSPDRWLAVTFSTLGGGNPGDQIARLLTGLFEAMMSTFRWGRE